jgi:hypothetical protein
VILSKARALVHGDRGAVYGPPSEDFSKQAIMFSQILRKKLTEPITPKEIALLMICVKLSRLENSPRHMDTVTDIAGYAETYAMILEEEESE